MSFEFWNRMTIYCGLHLLLIFKLFLIIFSNEFFVVYYKNDQKQLEKCRKWLTMNILWKNWKHFKKKLAQFFDLCQFLICVGHLCRLNLFWLAQKWRLAYVPRAGAMLIFSLPFPILEATQLETFQLCRRHNWNPKATQLEPFPIVSVSNCVGFQLCRFPIVSLAQSLFWERGGQFFSDKDHNKKNWWIDCFARFLFTCFSDLSLTIFCFLSHSLSLSLSLSFFHSLFLSLSLSLTLFLFIFPFTRPYAPSYHPAMRALLWIVPRAIGIFTGP